MDIKGMDILSGNSDKKDWNDTNCASTQNGFNQKRSSADLHDKIPQVKVSVEEKETTDCDPVITFTKIAQTNVGCMLEEAPLLYRHA